MTKLFDSVKSISDFKLLTHRQRGILKGIRCHLRFIDRPNGKTIQHYLRLINYELTKFKLSDKTSRNR